MRRRSSSSSSGSSIAREAGNQPSTAQITNTAFHSFPLALCTVLSTSVSVSDSEPPANGTTTDIGAGEYGEECFGFRRAPETAGSSEIYALSQTGASRGLESKAFELYEEEERKVEREKPHLLYRDVLSKTSLNVARKIGWELPEPKSNFLAKELPTWTPFPDTNPSLARLSTEHTLGILSNVDNDLLAGTVKHFTSPFEIRVTAENVRSYKPALGHFEEARRVIGDRHWTHVAASQYHDIEPAMQFGIKAVWVNRRGAHPAHDYSKRNVSLVRDLSQLADLLGSDGVVS